VIAPTRTTCLFALVPLVTAVSLWVAPGVWPVVAAIDAVAVAVVAADLATLPRRGTFAARREFEPVATRGVRHAITLVVENRARRAWDVTVVDDAPESLRRDVVPPLTLPPNSRVRVRADAVPGERGAVRLERVFIRAGSRLGLWTVDVALPVVDVLRVHPALAHIARYALYARLDRESLLGVRRTRRAGTDNEFERLRDYTPDDQYRAIDWRATSRRLRLTVRDHQTNQSQRVVFAVDCGRMMVNRVGGVTMFDAALDAALTLAHVALAKRDEAGLLCFHAEIERWMPPRGGRGRLPRMVAATYDVQPRLVETRFDAALLHLQRQCRKRTLFVVLTNLIDDRNADEIRSHLLPAVGRHLPLVVLLRDRSLFDAVESPAPAGAGPAADAARRTHRFAAGAAADVLCWRHQVLADLRHAGVLTLDVRPEDLTAALVNEYLAIKARHLL